MFDDQKTKPPASANAGGKTTTNLKPLTATASLVDAQNLSKQAAQKLSNVSLAQSAEQLAKRGLHIFPLSQKSKKPLEGSHGFKDATADLTKVKETWKASPECNIGVRTGTERDGKTLVVVDIDPRNGGHIRLKKLIAEHGPLPITLKAISGGTWNGEDCEVIRGEHYYFWAPSNLTYRKLGGIDIQAQNKYVVAPPSIHPDSGLAYEWVNASEEIADMPDWLVRLASQEKPRRKAKSPFQYIVAPDQLKDLESALTWIPSDYRPDWVRIGLALKSLGDEGYELWLEWSKKSDKFDEHEAEKTWASFDPDKINFESVFFEAEKYGWVNPWRKDTLQDLLLKIEVNGLIGLDDSKLIENVLQTLAKVRLDATQEERVLKALKAETKTTLKALRDRLSGIRKSLQTAGTFNLSGATPTEAADAFFQSEFVDGKPTLYLSQGDFVSWNGAQYINLDVNKMRKKIYSFFEQEGAQIAGKARYGDIVDALKAQTYLEAQTPCWLGDDEPPAPVDELLGLSNGILHLESGELYTASPSFFNDYAVNFDYDPHAPEPKNWLTFLNELFPTDPESIEALQQWFGYLLTRDTRYQKALMCVGPKRSGKGTIGRVWEGLIGAANITSPTITNLGTPFGLESLLGKSLAIMSDARLSKNSDVQAAAENILRITGEDSVSVGKKHVTNAEGRITARIVMFTNLLPALLDAGGALASRFIVIKFTQSFFGKEDSTLYEKKLKPELPSILNWSLEGLRKLREAGQFLQPESGNGAIKELTRESTPMLAFIEDAVILDANEWTLKDEVYTAYLSWVSAQRKSFTLAPNKFFTELYANSNYRIENHRPRVKGSSLQVNAVKGMRLNPAHEISAGDFKNLYQNSLI